MGTTGQPNFGYVNSAGFGILEAIQIGVQVVMALAFLYFLYNVFTFVKATSDEKKKEAKGKLVYGIVALFVMASAWGIVRIMQNVSGANNNTKNTDNICPPGMVLSAQLVNGIPTGRQICK